MLVWEVGQCYKAAADILYGVGMRKTVCAMICGLSLLFCSMAAASPVLLTISETENGQTRSWWPSEFGADSSWTDAFERQGVSVVVPSKMPNPPRLSPTVYGQKVLSDVNARTMASLFGAGTVLNGNVVWDCRDVDNGVECQASGTFNYLYSKQQVFEFKRDIRVQASNAESAKRQIISRLAVEMSMPLMGQTSGNAGIPVLIDKPVMIFDPLPDADTLVALRKLIKRIPGVEDVAERWVSDGVLAIEVNPGKPMSQSEFSQIIQGVVSENAENLMIRQTRQNDQGAILEVVKL